jgi:hypothetical protein
MVCYTKAIKVRIKTGSRCSLSKEESYERNSHIAISGRY